VYQWVGRNAIDSMIHDYMETGEIHIPENIK
jgi:hypothetical protein